MPITDATAAFGDPPLIGPRAAGVSVRAAARSGEVRFDWSDPETCEPAVAGASRMYLMAPQELPVAPAFVSAAVGAGVRRIVLLASRAIEAMGDERLMAAERIVKGAGVEWTIVRPSWCNQDLDEGVFREQPNDVVRELTGREPKAFDAYAAQTAATGAWREERR